MLATDDIQHMLDEIPLFAGCSPEALSEIARIAEERDCKKGEVIYEDGSEALETYVLVKGMVSFTTSHGTGHLNVQSLMKRHMIFGWAALVPEHPRRLGSAKCLEDCKLLAIDGDALLDILGRHPKSGFLVMKRLTSLIASTFVEKH